MIKTHQLPIFELKGDPRSTLETMYPQLASEGLDEYPMVLSKDPEGTLSLGVFSEHIDIPVGHPDHTTMLSFYENDNDDKTLVYGDYGDDGSIGLSYSPFLQVAYSLLTKHAGAHDVDYSNFMHTFLSNEPPKVWRFIGTGGVQWQYDMKENQVTCLGDPEGTLESLVDETNQALAQYHTI
jgi:hypothetical protein